MKRWQLVALAVAVLAVAGVVVGLLLADRAASDAAWKACIDFTLDDAALQGGLDSEEFAGEAASAIEYCEALSDEERRAAYLP